MYRQPNRCGSGVSSSSRESGLCQCLPDASYTKFLRIQGMGWGQGLLAGGQGEHLQHQTSVFLDLAIMKGCGAVVGLVPGKAKMWGGPLPTCHGRPPPSLSV